MRMVWVGLLLTGCLGREPARDVFDDCDGDTSQECIDARNEARCENRAGIVSDTMPCTGWLSIEEARALCMDLCDGQMLHPCDPEHGISSPNGCESDTPQHNACRDLIDTCP